MQSDLVKLLGAMTLVMGFAGTARADINLFVPTIVRPFTPLASDFNLDVNFTNNGASSPLVGYDVAFVISGPANGMTITGAETSANLPPNAVFPSDPVFSTHLVGFNTLYTFSDFLPSGQGNITDGSILLRLKLHADAGTEGTYNVVFFPNGLSAFDTRLYADATPTEVPSLTLTDGSVTFPVPEPTIVGVLGVGFGMMIMRRRVGV